MSKMFLTSSAAAIALSFSLGLVSEAGATSTAVCERVRHVCLGTGKSAEFCQANFEHCRTHKTFTGGLSSSDVSGFAMAPYPATRRLREDHPAPAPVEVQAPGSVGGGDGDAHVLVIGTHTIRGTGLW